ncbi:MAG: S24/S26 family peptidase [Clostridia bacterium]|nr:S24/S26 family peptidase [Clostridia bacterium]
MNDSIEFQLAQNGYYVSTTVGVSMRPMLRNRRDRVIIKPVGEGRLSKWDLPLYRRPDGKYVLHRIIGVEDGYYIIRGDNTYAKEKVPDEWILGVVTEFYRGERHVMADNKSYRRYAAFWQTVYPLRKPFHMARVFASRVKHKLFPKKKEP